MSYFTTITNTPAVEATPDYSLGDVLGGKQTLALATAGVFGPRGGVIRSAHIYSKVAITAAISLVVFNADPAASTFTENGALSVHANDLAKIVGVIPCSVLTDLGTPHSLQSPVGLSLPFQLANGATSLYVVAVAGGTENLGSTSDITNVLGIEIL